MKIEPEPPKYLSQSQLFMLQNTCKSIVRALEGRKDATSGEKATYRECKAILERIVRT